MTQVIAVTARLMGVTQRNRLQGFARSHPRQPTNSLLISHCIVEVVL